METNPGSESVELIPQYQYLQDGNPGNNSVILKDRGMGHIAGLQRCVFPHSNKSKVTKISEVFPVQSNFPVYSSSFWSSHSSPRVYQGGKGSETYVSSRGYPDPPESPVPGNLPTTYPDPLGPLPAVKVGCKRKKVRADPTTSLQFHRLPVRPGDRSGATHSGPVDNPPGEVEVHKKPGELYSQPVHVSDRTAHSNRKTSVVWSTSHEAHPMAHEATLACSRSFGKDHSCSSITSPPLRLVVGQKQCSEGPTLAPPSTRSSAVYRCLRRRLGHTLRGLHCKSRLVTPGKSPPHKFLGVKSSLSGPQEFRASLQGPDYSCSNRQHNCSLLHKQTGRYEIRLSLCPLETSVLVSPAGDKLKGSTHSGSAECDSKLSRHNQLIQTEWSLSQQVFNLLCSKWTQPQLDLFAIWFNHKLPKFVSLVPDPTAWAVDAMNLSWENVDAYAFPPVSLLSQVVSKPVDQGCHRMILIAPGWPNMPWFWDLVNLSVQIPFKLPLQQIW